jgi:hypothetical protein
MAEDTLIASLRRERPDYVEEATAHKFFLDAIFGTGGFRGKHGATSASQLGWAAEAYSLVASSQERADGFVNVKRDTYLDQFPREELNKFDKRIDIAHYTNYVGPILDLLLSYINKAAVNRQSVPYNVEEWVQNADGHGTPWDTLKREVIVPRAAALGWCPVLFDVVGTAGEYGAGEDFSRARRDELGISVRAIPLYPLNVIDFFCDDGGALVALKLRTAHTVRSDLLSVGVSEERYSLWYPDRVIKYTVRTEDGKQPEIHSTQEIAHSYGTIPLVSFRAKATPEDRLRGVSMVANSAIAARSLFNLESEMRDHIRNQVFATLGIPVSDMATNVGEIVSGTGSAIKVPHDSKMGLHYVAPPASCAETLERRMEVTVREIYRTEQVEHAKATGTQASSGIARAYEFEQTNKRLGGAAMTLARAEQEALRLVGSMLGDANAQSLTVSSPTDFSVEDLASEIDGVLTALTLKLGPTADTEMKRRLIGRMLPNLPVSTQEAIDSELDDLRLQTEQDDAFGDDKPGKDGKPEGDGEEVTEPGADAA